MKKMIFPILLAGLWLVNGCNSQKNTPFAYNGQLDATVVRLAAKTTGTIDSITVDEGQAVKKGQLLVKIDARKTALQLKGQLAQLDEIKTELAALRAKVQQVQSQWEFTNRTFKKTEAMYAQGAATEQQRDELATKVRILRAQLKELRSNRQKIESKARQLQAAIEVNRLRLKDCEIRSPLDGTVLNRFAEVGEWAMPGKELLEVADLRHLEATIYVPLPQLNRIKLGHSAHVHVDGLEQSFPARVKWISSEAEFTPKTILTKETRTTLVYAVKLDVDNPDGLLKIGMPVEVTLEE